MFRSGVISRAYLRATGATDNRCLRPLKLICREKRLTISLQSFAISGIPVSSMSTSASSAVKFPRRYIFLAPLLCRSNATLLVTGKSSRIDEKRSIAVTQRLGVSVRATGNWLQLFAVELTAFTQRFEAPSPMHRTHCATDNEMPTRTRR